VTVPKHATPDRVVVIGGGIAGLAAAHRLAGRGVAVTLLESSDQLGGLGTFFEHEDRWLERFYHCVMPSDDHLLPLLRELGITVRWAPTTMGMIVEGVRRPFNTALDLLRFRPLTLVQRVRFGVVSVLLRRLGRGRDLDNLRTEDWLRGLYGDVVWERLFRPMFGSKFGPEFGDVPALYLWQRLGRESNVATRGYPDGGYRAVVAAIRAGIEARNGVVRTSAPVRRVECDGPGVRVTLGEGADGSDSEVIDAEWCVSTVPLPLLASLADDDLGRRLPRSELRYQGVVNAVFFLRRALDGHYWSTVLHSGTGFDGVIEMSALTGPETYGGRHLVYVMHYGDRSSPLFAEDEWSIAARWTSQLLALYPDLLTPADVEAVRVFRAPFVEPVYPLGYAARRPEAEVAGTPLWLATTAQIYPEVTSWNSSTGLANAVADELYARIVTRHTVLRDVPAPRGPSAAGRAPSDLGS
jgi:protoporphyrinogen oxidase